MKTPIDYVNQFQFWNTDQQGLVSDCAEITFINQGTSLVILNGGVKILPNGGSISFDGKMYERDTTSYYFTFDTSTPGLINDLVVVRKRYSNYPYTTS